MDACSDAHVSGSSVPPRSMGCDFLLLDCECVPVDFVAFEFRCAVTECVVVSDLVECH